MRNFYLMNIRKLIREILSENYPAGAANDSSAPWLQKEPTYSNVTEPKTKEFSTIGLFPNELAILQDVNGQKYAFYFNTLDKSDFAPYAQREIIHTSKGEDGPEHDYSDDWSIDNHVIDGYVNDNASHMTRGVGMEAWQNGLDLDLIDDALKVELLNTFGKNQSIQSALA